MSRGRLSSTTEELGAYRKQACWRRKYYLVEVTRPSTLSFILSYQVFLARQIGTRKTQKGSIPRQGPQTASLTCVISDAKRKRELIAVD